LGVWQLYVLRFVNEIFLVVHREKKVFYKVKIKRLTLTVWKLFRKQSPLKNSKTANIFQIIFIAWVWTKWSHFSTCSFICQVISTRRQRRDLFGFRGNGQLLLPV